MTKPDDTTLSFGRSAQFSEAVFGPPQTPLRFEFGGGSDIGRVRKRNDDHYAIVERKQIRSILSTNLPNTPELPDHHVYGLMVADGIGGSAAGNIASRLTLETVFELAGRTTRCLMSLDASQKEQLQERVQAYLREVQQTLRTYSALHPEAQGMGTTWTSAHIFSPQVLVVHVGDSRMYLLRGDRLQKITEDQTYGAILEKAGLPKEKTRPFRHVLTNSLSDDGTEVTADLLHLELQVGDRLLLCTDGLSDMLSNDKIEAILTKHLPAQATCDKLIEAALGAGGKDNVTVALCDVLEDE